MSRKKDFPVWFKMLITLLPVAGFFVVLVALALGVEVNALVFTPLAVLTGTIIAEVLGLVPINFRKR